MNRQAKFISLSLVLVMAALLCPSASAQDDVTCRSEQIIYGRYECTFAALRDEPVQFDCANWRLYNDQRVQIISGGKNDPVRLANAGNYRVVCYDGDQRISITHPQPTPSPRQRALIEIRSESNPTVNSICTCLFQFLCSALVALFSALIKFGVRGLGNLIGLGSDDEKKKKNTL